MKKKMLASIRALGLFLALILLISAFASCAKVNENGSLDLLHMDMTKYITLGDYRATPYEFEVKKVTDADVEEALQKFEMDLSTYEDYIEAPVSRPTVENDYLQISYIGRVDGEVVDQSPENSPQYILLADGNGYYEWFNAALRGIEPGETVFAEGQLGDGENYGEYAGRIITYEITLVAIMGHYTFTEMTDEVVKEKTGHESIAAYREALYTELLDARKEAVLASVYQDAWEKAQECSTIKRYPNRQVKYYYDAFYGNYTYIAYQNGVNLDTVLAQYGVDKNKIREMAKASCAEDLFYYALVQAEGLEVTDEEYAERVGGIAKGQGMSVEELETEYGKEYIRDSMLYDEAILFVAHAANVNYIYVD